MEKKVIYPFLWIKHHSFLLFVFRTDTRIGQRGAISPPPFPTQAEVAEDASLYSPAMYLRRSDILLAVIIYKTVETDQEITYYARVVQSLRGGHSCGGFDPVELGCP